MPKDLARPSGLPRMTVDALVQLLVPRGGDVSARDRQILLDTVENWHAGKPAPSNCLLHEMAGSQRRVKSGFDPSAAGHSSLQPRRICASRRGPASSVSARPEDSSPAGGTRLYLLLTCGDRWNRLMRKRVGPPLVRTLVVAPVYGEASLWSRMAQVGESVLCGPGHPGQGRTRRSGPCGPGVSTVLVRSV